MTQDNPTPPPGDPTTPPPTGTPVGYASPATPGGGGMFTPPPAPIEPAPVEQRTMGMLTHLLALSGFIGIPFGNIVGPLIIWLIKKDEMPFVNDQGKESLNFQITVMILAIIISPTICLAGLGLLLLLALAVAGVVLTIVASVKANQGIYYRYPMTARLIK